MHRLRANGRLYDGICALAGVTAPVPSDWDVGQAWCTPLSLPRQANSHDCGFYMMYFAHAISIGKVRVSALQWVRDHAVRPAVA
jgi:hypothetical protein